MNYNNINCPVCGCKIQNGDIEFCPECGWELIVISENASISLKKYYDEKVEKHKNILLQATILKEDISTKIVRITTLESEKKELIDNQAKFNLEFVKKKEELKNLESKVDNSEKKQIIVCNLEKEIVKLKKEIFDIKLNNTIPRI